MSFRPFWHSTVDFLTKHEVTHKVTFSAVCAVYRPTFPGRLSTELVALSYILEASQDVTHFNSYSEISSVILCSAFSKQIQIFNQNTAVFIEQHGHEI